MPTVSWRYTSCPYLGHICETSAGSLESLSIPYKAYKEYSMKSLRVQTYHALLLTALTLLLWLLWATHAWGGAAEYHVTVLPRNVIVRAISPAGHLAGSAGGLAWVRLASGKTLTFEGPAGPSWHELTAISDSLVAGRSYHDGTIGPDDPCQPAWTAGLRGQAPQVAPYPAGLNCTQINGINSNGTMAGESWGRAVAWVSGRAFVLPTALGGWSGAQAVSQSGVMVGYDGGHATRWTADGLTRLTPFWSTYSMALAVNDHGTTTGAFFPGEHYQDQAFVWLEGSGFQALPLAPGDHASYGHAVRADGVVFGISIGDAG
jgi:hypothetical protein